MPTIEIDLTERQHAIMVLLDKNRFQTNKDIAQQLDISAHVVANDLTMIGHMVGVKSRLAMPDALRKAGWLPYQEAKPETTEQQVRRLISPTFGDGECKEAAVLSEVVYCEAARLTQLVWMTHEVGGEVTIEQINSFKKRADSLHAALFALYAELDKLRSSIQ